MGGLRSFFYRFLIYPLLVAAAHIAALFNKNIREAVNGRYRAAKELASFQSNDKAVAYFHAASLGEFEHIRPLIYYLGQSHRIVVTFFSPSGFNHAKKQFTDELHLYLPFDFLGLWEKIYRTLKPTQVIISKHDVWAHQILAATKLNVPIYLVNASLPANSSRLNGLYRYFYGPIYRKITKIFAISQEDKERFEKYFNLKNVEAVGDTKFDQVIIRKAQAQGKNLVAEKWMQNAQVLVLGSIWPEDYAVLVEPLRKLMQEFPLFKIIFVPHQPHEVFLKRILSDFDAFGCKRFSHGGLMGKERCLLVDVVGVLADLYKYAHLAYVGGSFKQGIHNVMEPAVYGIPVFFGPEHENSYEAKSLVQVRAAEVVRTPEDIFTLVKNLLTDDDFRQKTGVKVLKFVEDHTGATKRILETLNQHTP